MKKNKSFFNKILNTYNRLIFGDNLYTPFEKRILILIIYSTFVISIIGNIFNIIFGFSIDLILVTFLASIILLILFIKIKKSASIKRINYIVFVLSLVFLALLFILDAGYDGNILFLGLTYFVAIYVIIPTHRRFLVFLSYLLLFLSLILLQYLYPEIIINYYKPSQRFVDLFIGFILYFLLLYSIISVISNNFIFEQHKVKIKNEQLKNSNKLLEEKNLALRELSKSLKESEEKYKQVIESTNDGIWEWNPQTGKTKFNQRYFSMLGYNKGDFEENIEAFKKLIHPDDLDKTLSFFERSDTNDDYFFNEFRLKAKDGSWKYILSRGKILERDKEGNITLVVGVHTDITNLKIAEENLKQSEIMFRSIWENSLDGMRLINSNAEIIKVNDAFCRLVKKKRDELEGKPVEVIYSENEGLRVKKSIIKNWKEDKLTTTFEKKTTLWTGEEVWFEISNAYIDLENQGTYLLSIFRDITNRKETEKQLSELINQKNTLISELEVSKQNLENINKTKDKFFSIIAHDLKNPFMGILGFSDILKTNVKSFDTLRIEHFANRINEAANQAYKLLENLLEWSRTQIGSINYEPDYYNALEIIKNCIRFSESSAKLKQITIDIDCDNKTNIYVDLNLFNTILRNLITNAIKFSYKNSSIKIHCQNSDKHFLISIIDQGIGMSPEVLENVFNIDKVLSNKGTEGEEGTGLGLIICKEFVKKLGGEIFVKSELGSGTTVTFSVPLEKNTNNY